MHIAHFVFEMRTTHSRKLSSVARLGQSSQPPPARLTSAQPTRTSQAGAREMSNPIRRRVDLSHKIRIHSQAREI